MMIEIWKLFIWWKWRITVQQKYTKEYLAIVKNNKPELHTATETELKNPVFGGKGKK